MQTKTKLVLAIMAVCVLLISLGAALGVVYLTREYMDESARREAELEAERMAQIEAELERESIISPELKEQLDFVIAMEEAIEKKDGLVATREMSPEEFEALTDLEVVEIIAYELLPTEYVDWDAEMKKPMEERGVTETLTAPKGHYRAGDFEKMPASLERDLPLEELRFGAFTALGQVTGEHPLLDCIEAQSDDMQEADAHVLCVMQTLDTLSKLRLGRPLYRSVARLDPLTLSKIFIGLQNLDPDTPMFDGERTLAQVYRQLDGSVAPYIEAREAIAAYGDERALSRYRKELETRGMGYRANGPDMIAFYDDFAKELGLQYAAIYAVGFWLRRMDDGSAPIILGALEKARTRYAK